MPTQRLLDFIQELATSTSTRRRFAADPDALIASRGLSANQAKALRSGNKDLLDLALLAEQRGQTP